jgi:hypothetical protein
VYVGRQHHLAVEIGGQQFELTLNNQPTEAGSSAAAAPLQQQALPMPQVSTAVMPVAGFTSSTPCQSQHKPHHP